MGNGLAGDWRGMVVLVAGVTWEGNRLGAQHIAERLTRYAPVLYVDPPRTPLSTLRKPWMAQSHQEPRLRLLQDRLARLTVVVPPAKTRPGMRTVATASFRHQVRRAVRALGGDVAAVVQVPPHFPVLGTLGERVSVHLASDDFVAGAQLNDVAVRWVRGREREVSRRADRVVAVSPVLEEKWRALGHDPVLMTNGCDYDLFAGTDTAVPAPEVTLRRPVAGFIGTLNERTDADLLEAVAEAGHSVLLVGPRSEAAPHAALDRIFARPNVQWVGPKRHHEVPSYLRHVDVGLVPYTDSPFNRASFPLKVLDYLSAGLPVVANDLPSVRWLGTDLTELTTGRQAFADAVARALATPRDEALVARRRAFAAQHSWDRRVEQLAGVLGLTAPGTAGGQDAAEGPGAPAGASGRGA
ncbi:glycosyltransferase [Vallicoccus soli]|uniref:Glycosyltransferase n=1 Tax=Vallicoccus soli TaxID=2339232 RepID=A0A3A3Z380_9ACTN|nr:glycosyltransferase [Vallicoccus soli]RJK97874.1 glycosyltransferase [Vallicoccus soli]